MPNSFDTTRTPGSLSNTYDLAAHVAAADPHSQYLKKTDYSGSGSIVTSNDLEIHKSDPNAHGDAYVKPAVLNDYYTKDEVDALFANEGITLYHDPVNDANKTHAASMYAVNQVYLMLDEHRKPIQQSGGVSGHLDTSGLELYARRVHTHTPTECGAASSGHNHDDRYSVLSHNHDDRYAFTTHSHNYLSATELEMYGLYRTVSDVVSDEYDFNEETTFGNYAIPASVFSIALNKPNINSTTKTSFLSVLVNNVTEDSDGTYGEKNCSQTLTTEYGVLYRLGHSAGGSSENWTFTDWTWVCNGNKNVFEIFYSASTTPPPGAFPLWTGEWIRNCATLYPDFYQKAIEYRKSQAIRVVDNDTYESTLTTYGQCGAFVISGNDIRLPKITMYLKSFSNPQDIGVTLPAGLPNITGELPVGEGFSESSEAALAFTGAFRAYEPVNHWGNGGGWDTDNLGVNFDASRCSSVYGASNTVQPPSVQLALYIQVYNSVTVGSAAAQTSRTVSIMKYNFQSTDWSSDGAGLYTYNLTTTACTVEHVFKTETGGAVTVDESVEIHIVGSVELNSSQRQIKLIAPEAFSGYLIACMVQ